MFYHAFVSPSTHIDMNSTTERQLRLERSVLESNYSYLVEAIVPKDILPELFSQKLITKSQKEEADSHQQKYDKNVAILDSLLGRAEVGAFHRFCDVLSMTSGQEYIADKLTTCKLTCYVCSSLLKEHKMNVLSMYLWLF